jgi:type II secretory pathway predicted ATPase ExeA
LIEQKKYFVLHAPRQTGKTSCLLALIEYLNRQGHYRALYINVEAGQAARENIQRGVHAILSELANHARFTLNDLYLTENFKALLDQHGGENALNAALTLWAESSPRPIVLMIDEIDALVGDTLISVLRQLRAGYTNRPGRFPQSVVLCGVRDVRDYRIHSAREKAIITGGSAFNVKAVSLRLGDFSQEDMKRLYLQHTAETGQVFTPEALALAWELTHGQPWLVNALAYETCFQMKSGRDRSQPVRVERLIAAKENLILRRETHLDQLTDKLREPRVRRVIEPILQGEVYEKGFDPLDVQYVVDLGLVRQTRPGELQVANHIYREVIPRELTWGAQTGMAIKTAWYLYADGRLDMAKLLASFQQFFREHSEHWVERFDYKEAGPQLLLQAFLQRIVNGGGRVEREYGLGRQRTDLLVLWPFGVGEGSPQAEIPYPKSKIQRVVIELKLLRGSLEKTLSEGLEQTWGYADRCGAEEAHLVIFDRRAERTWEEKIFCRQESWRGLPVTVWGM